MKTTNEKMLANYKFENKKRTIKVAILGNVVLFVLCFFANFSSFQINPFAVSSLISAVLIFGISKAYSWKDHEANLVILALYISIFMFELILLGIPNPVMEISKGSTRGLFMEILFYILPFTYTGLRIALAFPLINVYLASKELK